MRSGCCGACSRARSSYSRRGIAPRFAEVAAWLSREGVPFVSASQQLPCDAATQVLLVDTLGELLDFYAAGDIAFVGGSLVGIGGHNLLEPAALGLPIFEWPLLF